MSSTDMHSAAIPGTGAVPGAVPGVGTVRRLAQVLARFGHAFDDRPVAAPASAAAEPFRLYAPDQVSAHQLLVVEGDGSVLWNAASDMRHDTRVDRCASFAEAEVRISAARAMPWLVVMDIDGFPTTVDAVDSLRRFRRDNPAIPVVIASSFFARHDFSCERKAIADASVRLPCGRATLALAIGSAIENSRPQG